MSEEKFETQSPPRKIGYLLPGIIIAIVIGAVVGGFMPKVGIGFEIVGDLFMSALKMLVVPLVMASIICGIAALGDIRKLGSIGRRTITYYLITTGLSVIIGLVLVNVVRPGDGMLHGEERPGVTYHITGNAIALDEPLERTLYGEQFVLTLDDQGIEGRIDACAHEELTVVEWTDAEGEPAEPDAEGAGMTIALARPERIEGKKSDALDVLGDVVRGMIPKNVFQSMAEGKVLPLIFFSLLLGAVLTTLGKQGQPALRFFQSLNEAIMGLVHWVMMVAPIGIFGLIAARIGRAGGFEGFWPELAALGKYFATVVSGLAIHGIIVLPLLLWVLARRSPVRYARNMVTALLNAFSTASSSATLPLTMEAVEDRNGVSSKTAAFVLPLGATINMDGTALYEAVAAMFIAQAFGIEMTIGHMVVIFLTATLASIGAAGIPEAGLVTMLIVLKAVDLPLEGVALILTIDWLLDRFRTTVNVWGDSVGAGIVEARELRSGATPARAERP